MAQEQEQHILQSLKSTLSVLLITIVSISAIVYLIWQRNSVDTVMKDIDRLTRQREQIKIELTRLNRRVASLSNITRIRSIAEKNFQLREAKRKPILLVVDELQYKNDLSKLEDRLKQRETKIHSKRMLRKAGF